jgi:hypothetical protein
MQAGRGSLRVQERLSIDRGQQQMKIIGRVRKCYRNNVEGNYVPKPDTDDLLRTVAQIVLETLSHTS